MSLEGAVFLALWNDFDAERDAEYEAWHSAEHVPERVAVPGILRGRRYRAAERSEDRFFTLYEIEAGDVLNSAAYLDLVANPTEWSADMRPHFRNVRRMPCETVVSIGQGIAGHVATLSVRLPRAQSRDNVQALERWGRETVDMVPAIGFHAGLQIAALSDYPVFAGEQSVDVTNSLALIVEAASRDAALETAQRSVHAIERMIGGAQASQISVYDFVLAVDHDELEKPPSGRFAPRSDLRARTVRMRT